MRRLQMSLLGAGIGLALVAAAARPVAHRAVFPGAATAIADTRELANRVPGAERLEYRSADGTALAAMWMPARASTRPAASLSENGESRPAASLSENGRPAATVVYFHATNQAAADAFFFARDLAGRGMNVCVPEHRGYGGLAGEPTGEAILEDAEAALAACPATGPRVLVGRSLGAAVAAEMAARGQADALVLVSPFTSLAEVASPFGWALAPADRLDVRAALRAVRVPVTVLHGTRDRLIPFRMGQELAGLAGARWIPLARVGHNELFLGDARQSLLGAIAGAAEEASRGPLVVYGEAPHAP